MTATAAAVRERPILFSGEMVRAILDVRKTQTRRVVVPQPDWTPEVRHTLTDNGPFAWPIGGLGQQCGWPLPLRYQIGERLWVRERHVYVGGGDLSFLGGPDRVGVLYSVDEEIRWLPGRGEDLIGEIVCNADRRDAWKHRPSIHMPRWASRLTLEITGVRVERVQQISDADVDEEGIEVGCFVFCTTENCWRGADDDLLSSDGLCPKCGGSEFLTEEAQDLYANLWDSLNKKRGYGWDVNPWVWVVEFRKVAL